MFYILIKASKGIYKDQISSLNNHSQDPKGTVHFKNIWAALCLYSLLKGIFELNFVIY